MTMTIQLPGAGVTVMARRRDLGLTMTELAELAGTTRQTLRMLERFNIVPGRGIAERIAAALGLSIDALPGRPALEVPKGRKVA